LSAYLGKPVQIPIFGFGLISALLAQSALLLLAEVFRPRNEPFAAGKSPQEKETLRQRLLLLAIAALSMDAFIAYLLFLQDGLSIIALILLVVSLFLALFHSMPPLALARRGLGELVSAAHLAYVIPSIGFALQYKNNHPLLILVTLPLTLLALAYFLILNFPTFAEDQKYERATLLHWLTWERAVPLHHALITLAYVTLAIALALRFFVLWVGLLTLPFGILQILLLRQISLGAKPNWKLLSSTALAVFGFTAYFISLNFWIR